jgi:dipeptidyl aminopeptidase/acylaminoacyl peptidase
VVRIASEEPIMTLRCCVLVAGVLLFATGELVADDKVVWEELSHGVQGRLAIFEGVGGAKIAGYVRKPAGAGPFPLVIVLHGGGPTAKAFEADTAEERAKQAAVEAERASRVLGKASNPPIPDFLARGWAVYSIDYRTNPRYLLDPLEWDDTVIAVKLARSFPFVDSKRIAMMGGSHGGHVTARMASRVDLACAVLCAPAGLDLIELSHLAAKGKKIGGNQRLIRELEKRAGVTMAEIEKDPGKYGYSSPLTEVARVRCPILMISGRNDDNAPLPVMEAYMAKVRATGKRTESYHPDNGPHGFYWGIPRPIPETAESTRRAVAFIAKCFEKPAP